MRAYKRRDRKPTIVAHTAIRRAVGVATPGARRLRVVTHRASHKRRVGTA
jgi:hypothetical protein